MRWLVASEGGEGAAATWTAAVVGGLRSAGDEVAAVSPSALPPSWSPWWTALRARLGGADRALISGWPLALRMGGSFDVVFHGADLTVPAADAAGFQRVCERADRRLTVSHYLRELMEARGFPATALPAPIDPLPPRSAPRAPERWGMVGRATPLAGGDRFVRLVAAAGARGTVVGDGPELRRWRALAAELRADVRFTGWVPRAQALREIAGFDIAFLLPRTERVGTGAEGLGIALLEAAALGVPAVGCRTGGVPEAVGPGLLLDDPDDLAASLGAVRGWWGVEAGRRAREWLGDTHGAARTVAALRGRT